MAEISERSFEETIESVLLLNGPDEMPFEKERIKHPPSHYEAMIPGGYSKRQSDEYDRSLCLIAKDVLDFIYTSQPKEWQKYENTFKSEAKDRFVKLLHREIDKRGTLDVLRKEVKDSGCKFKLAFFHPSSGLNEELQRKYLSNIFSVTRQLHFSESAEKSLDLVLFLNGLPIITVELKNPLTGQNVEDAIKQYRFYRSPREPLFKFGRCLAHFAVDPDLVYITTHLKGSKTRFLPFNQGKFGGAGNPPVMEGYATAYLWKKIWSKDSILNLLQHFIHEIDIEDDKGKKTGEKAVIFPRFHQLDSVRRLIDHAKAFRTGHKYLIQHSAGSGKSNSIAWLAHQLSILHDDEDKRIFDSVIVITDRKVLDRQLQRTVRQFEQTRGVVENIDKTSKQLKEALEMGKTIIVTTLQKFPVICGEIGQLPGKQFAVIIDEAHSSQSGESVKSLKKTLIAESLEEAEKEDQEPEEDLEDQIIAEMKSRGRLPNVSYFAFTATPKAKTLELFGHKKPDRKYEPFSLYTMRQAIEEQFIIDVLENYTTHKVYWNLLKKIKDDPRYDRKKAVYLLRSFVDLHEHAIRKKVEIMIEYFHNQVAHRIDGRAKAMIVSRSRLHAVRYKLMVHDYLKEKGYPYKELVAFSGTVRDAGIDYTEANMNGFSEAQTALMFERPEYRILIVAEKFQTGFDQPLLHTMYVDKRLKGLHAVQTLSRLNRIHLDKTETMVLDFSNIAEDIQKAFQPYYEKTILSEGTDPRLLYDLERSLSDFHIYNAEIINEFARIYFNPKSTQDQLYNKLAPIVELFMGMTIEEQTDFRGKIFDYVRLYAFLSQIISFTDANLEKLYVFSRLLRRYLPSGKEDLPKDIQQKIDMASYRISKGKTQKIHLERQPGEVTPDGTKDQYGPALEEIEPLSQIIKELNERFGTDFKEKDKIFISELQHKLMNEPSLTASIRANTPENARLTFNHVVNDRLQEMIETNFKFYKRITDDKEFSKYFLDWLFEKLRIQAV